jgi:predicted RNase H-like HicB family nuclease
MPQSRIEIYDTPKLQYRVCFHAVRRGYIVTVPALEELAVFGTNIKQARIAAATAIEALTEDLEANGVPVAKRDPLAVSMTENIERNDPSLVRPARAHGVARSPALALRRVGLCAERDRGSGDRRG